MYVLLAPSFPLVPKPKECKLNCGHRVEGARFANSSWPWREKEARLATGACCLEGASEHTGVSSFLWGGGHPFPLALTWRKVTTF
jgi:hypothetical protein